MPNLQLVAHQLISMLTVSFAQVLMQHNAVADRQTTIHSINQYQYKISQIACLDNKPTCGKQNDKGNTNTTNITCKTLRLSLRSEIKDAEHQYAQDSHDQIRGLNKTRNTRILNLET